MKIQLPLLLFVSTLTLSAQTGVFAITGARVVDGTGAPAKMATVIVRDHRIEAVGENLPVPVGARVIDAKGQTLIPGLFDLHTHLRASGALSPLVADWGKVLKTYLVSGVTSVNEYSSYGPMFEPMRRLMREGVVVGPRVNLAVRVSPPGGHGAESGYGSMFTLEARTPEKAHEIMAEALSYKPELIKIFTDGWRYGASPSLPSMNEETIAAIVADAHKAGVKVMTHTLTLENAKVTVRAGVDSLVHGIQDRAVDDEFVNLIKSKGTGYTATLAVYEPRNRSEMFTGLDRVLEPLISQMFRRPQAAPAMGDPGPRQERWKRLTANDFRLFENNVLLGNGTDAGMGGTFHGWATLREIQLKTQEGLTPLQAITVATRNSARILGVDSKLGTIEAGKQADLVLIDGKPDQQIEDIYKTARVFLDGKEYDIAALQKQIKSDEMTKLPSHPVQALIDDFEQPDGRTRLGTNIFNGDDPGSDHSNVVFTRIWRSAGNHSLMVEATMGPRERPFSLLQIPLTPGAVELADVSAFHGISFDVRGDGAYRLKALAYAVRSGSDFEASFQAGADWKTQRIDFSSFTRQGPPVPWTGRDVRMLQFELSGPPGSRQWLELDNLRFY
jgi:imidazolonepropionase-like amidohydrolase